jgi:SAM-dependent methyltransferase
LTESIDLTALYHERFNVQELQKKNRVWQVLCRHFFQRYVRHTDTVLDLGAGSCEFLNNIVCAERIAVDLNPEVETYARQGTRVLLTSGEDLSAVASESVDVVFVSNFFEHLPDKMSFLRTLYEIRRVLRRGGRLLILQPNIRAIGGQYWDFVDHHLPLTDRTLVEALGMIAMDVQEVRARFLPYTTKSRIPQHPMLIRLYLLLPLTHRFLGGQAWVVGIKP